MATATRASLKGAGVSWTAVATFGLLGLVVAALISYMSDPLNAIGYSLSFSSGVSMIFLPCTLPLVFYVVPLSIKSGHRKGILVALSFGLGVTITLSIFGVFTASLGQYFGLNRSMRLLFGVAGIVAYLFALSELGIVKISTPQIGAAKFASRYKDFVAPFVFGLLLGDAGIGCPNPAFYLLLSYIAGTANVAQGAILGFFHGLGRATPLIFLAGLGLLGINLAPTLARSAQKAYNVSNFAILAIGSWILAVGLFGDWFELTVFHDMWDNLIYYTFGPNVAEREADLLHVGYLGLGWQVAILVTGALFFVPTVIYFVERRKNSDLGSEPV